MNACRIVKQSYKNLICLPNKHHKSRLQSLLEVFNMTGWLCHCYSWRDSRYWSAVLWVPVAMYWPVQNEVWVKHSAQHATVLWVDTVVILGSLFMTSRLPVPTAYFLTFDDITEEKACPNGISKNWTFHR